MWPFRVSSTLGLVVPQLPEETDGSRCVPSIVIVGSVAATVNVIDENTLTLTVPSVASGPQDIVLTRGDETTYTLENGIVLL